MGADSEIVARLAQTHFLVERAACGLVARRVAYTAMVVVVRPADLDATVIAHDAHIGLRAAVRVAAAAGNNRAWNEAVPMVQRFEVSRLPPVINLAAKRDRIRSCHMAGVYAGERLAAVAIWFSRRERDTASAMAYRNDTFSILQAAARRG